MVEEKKSDEADVKQEEPVPVKEKAEKPAEETPLETAPLESEKPKALLEERKDNTIEEKKVDEPSLAPENPEDHNSTSIKEKRADLPAEPETEKIEPTVTPSDAELEKTTIAATTPKKDESSESKESEESAEDSMEKDDKKN